MLHAVNGRKAKLGMFRGAGRRVPIEDIVTSAVFGPLDFFAPQERMAVLQRLLKQLNISCPGWMEVPKLLLWPQHANVPRDLRRSYVEPDLVISDQAGSALIVEVKWGAPLGARELASQWLSLSHASRRTSVHLLLVLEPNQYGLSVKSDVTLVASRSGTKWPLFVISWRQAADAFRAIGADPDLGPGTRRWADGVHAFLRREDPGALVGWPSLGLMQVQPLGWRVRTSALMHLVPPQPITRRFIP
jgi:hypothetical protein